MKEVKRKGKTKIVTGGLCSEIKRSERTRKKQERRERRRDEDRAGDKRSKLEKHRGK